MVVGAETVAVSAPKKTGRKLTGDFWKDIQEDLDLVREDQQILNNMKKGRRVTSAKVKQLATAAKPIIVRRTKRVEIAQIAEPPVRPVPLAKELELELEVTTSCYSLGGCHEPTTLTANPSMQPIDRSKVLDHSPLTLELAVPLISAHSVQKPCDPLRLHLIES